MSTIRGTILIIVMLTIGIFTVSAALAQPSTCLPRDAWLNTLTESYHEVVAAQGSFSQGRVMVELFVNTRTGTWTLLGSTADGISCAIAAGQNWHTIEGTDV